MDMRNSNGQGSGNLATQGGAITITEVSTVVGVKSDAEKVFMGIDYRKPVWATSLCAIIFVLFLFMG
jgi:hypothetical protein